MRDAKRARVWPSRKRAFNPDPMTSMISRDAFRFDPIYGDVRHRAPPRLRARRSKMALPEAPASTRGRDVRQFLTAFAGGFVFLSVMIF